MNKQPPQKLSIQDTDYDPSIGANIIITLDGERQDSVISYDVASGTLERHKKVDGKYVIHCWQLAVEKMSGVVGVSWK